MFAALHTKSQHSPGYGTATVDELVRSLTAIGSTARDIIDILQSLKAAGALDAQIEVL